MKNIYTYQLQRDIDLGKNWISVNEAIAKYEPEITSEAIQLAKDLAEWSRKYPRGRIYSASNMQMDEELVAMEERAKKIFPNIP